MANLVASFDTVGPTPVQIGTALPHTLFGYDIGNVDGSPAFVMFYDKATAPVVNVDLPIMKVLVPPGRNTSRTSSAGIAFAAGIWIVVSTMHGVQALNVSGHVEFI